MTDRPDITTRADIDRLIEVFYADVMTDPQIGHIFTEVAKIDPVTHFPRIAGFWESVLFDRGGYTGNPVQVHLELNRKVELDAAAFGRWLELWNATVDRLFAGATAEKAKQRAMSIAFVMQSKLRGGM